MKRKYPLAVILYCLPGLIVAPDVSAAIYKYVDKDGIVCFADDLQFIPAKYRSKAVIVDGEAKEEIKESGPVVAYPRKEQSTEIAGERESRPSRSLSFRLMVSTAVVLAMALVFIILMKQAFVTENKKVYSIIRASFIGILSLYLIIAHGRDVLTVFGMAGKAIDDAQQRSAEKGKKAAEAIKKLDALFEQAQKAQEASSQPGDDHNK